METVILEILLQMTDKLVADCPISGLVPTLNKLSNNNDEDYMMVVTCLLLPVVLKQQCHSSFLQIVMQSLLVLWCNRNIW